MFVLLLVLILILFGSGFLNPLWWWAAAVLVLDPTRHGRTVRTAGTVNTGRAGGARTAGTSNAAGDR